jgi:ABC-type transport system substrate-binding protein
LYKEGQLDIYHFSYSPGEELDQLMHLHADEYVSNPELSTFFIGLNWAREPLDDHRVREALALATDQRAVCGVALGGFSQPACGGTICPGMPGHSKDIGLPFAPDRARRLLAEAGFPGGRGFPNIECLTTELDVHQAVSSYLRERWSDILGLDMHWESAPWQEYIERIQLKPERLWMPDIWTQFWSADYPDPYDFLSGLKSRQLAWRENEILDLLERSQGVVDLNERTKLCQEVDRRIVEEAVIIPIAYGRLQHLVKPWVKRFRLTPHRLLLLKDIIMTPHA